MDWAGPDPVHSVLWAQGQHLHDQREQLALVWRFLEEIPAAGASSATSVSQPSLMAAFSSSAIRFSSPEQFSSEPGDFHPFLAQCEQHFEFQAVAFPSGGAGVAYIISYFSGGAKAWAMAKWTCRSATCNSFPLFTETFKQIFQSATPGWEAVKALVELCQGKRSVLDYTIEFCTFAADSGWNQPAFVDVFSNGLTETIKDHLIPLNLPLELNALISFVDLKASTSMAAEWSVPPLSSPILAFPAC